MPSPLFHYLLIHGLIAVIPISLGVFVVLKNTRNPLYWAFLRYNFIISWWGTFTIFMEYANSPEIALLWDKVSLLGIVFIPPAFLHFTWMYSGRSRHYDFVLRLCYGLSAIFFFLVFTPLMAKSATPKYIIPYFTDPGFAYHFFVIYFSIVMTFGNLLVFNAWRRCKSQGRKGGIFLFLLATSISTIGGGGNFLVPYEVYIPVLFPYGGYTFILYGFLIAYTILRYSFLDIEVVIRKTLVFAGLFAMVMAVISLVTTLTQGVIGRFLNVPVTFSTAISVALAMLLYDPTRKLLVNLTDRFLFQKKFSLTTMIAQASEAISLVQSLKWLARRIIAFLVIKCRIKHAVVYIRNGNKNFSRGAIRGYALDQYPPPAIPAHHDMIRYLEKTRRPVSIYRFEEEMREKNPMYPREEFEQIKNMLMELKAELVVPSFLRRRIDVTGLGREKTFQDEEVELRSLLILGGKKSDESYSDEELEVFSSLAQESAIAIENARLYDEAVQRSRELSRMNKELEETNERLSVTQASLIVAEKNATMVNMAKAIGHEVNNPLTSVMLLVGKIQITHLQKVVQVINRNAASLPESDLQKLRETLAGIESDSRKADRSAQRISAVVHTLTNILKDSKDEMTALSLLVLCREAIEATRFSTSEENLSGCEIVQDTAANILILGNVEQLLQVFVNLIKNAYEAMENQKDRKIVISGNVDPQNPQMARIEISDNGPGIPQEVLPKIWNQGFSTKAKESDSIGAAGQGQGLFVSKHIIESIHKGVITVESAVGKGTKFIIELPLAEVHGDV